MERDEIFWLNWWQGVEGKEWGIETFGIQMVEMEMDGEGEQRKRYLETGGLMELGRNLVPGIVPGIRKYDPS